MAQATPPESPAEPRPPFFRRIGELVARIDRFGVDGLVNACGFGIFALAEGLRTLQTGKAQLALLIAMAVLVATLIAVMLGLPNLVLGWGGTASC